jgi:hypothetical protein
MTATGLIAHDGASAETALPDAGIGCARRTRNKTRLAWLSSTAL